MTSTWHDKEIKTPKSYLKLETFADIKKRREKVDKLLEKYKEAS